MTATVFESLAFCNGMWMHGWFLNLKVAVTCEKCNFYIAEKCCVLAGEQHTDQWLVRFYDF
jgi:hypothetical protein